MNKLVSIIIVNWNGINHLKKCLPSLFSQKYKKTEIIIVDNASNDDSVSYIKRNFPKSKIIQNGQNLGFAEANNVGYKHAKGDYILFLNNDTEVTPNFLSSLVKSLEEKHEIGAVQSKILLMDEPTKHDSVATFLTFTGFLFHYGTNREDSEKYNKKIYTYSAKGACMLFKSSILKKVEVEGSIYDPEYFAYFEETDLCHRVWLLGYKVMYDPSSVIYHKRGATSSTLNSSFVQYHSFKNRINSYLKNFGTGWILTILPIHLLVCEVAAIVFLFSGRWKISLAIQSAIWWNLKTIFRTIRLRKTIQSFRKVEDTQLKEYIYKSVKPSYYFHLLSGLRNYKEEEL